MKGVNELKAKLIIILIIGILIGIFLGGILIPANAKDYDYQVYKLLKEIQKDVDDIEYYTHCILLNQ